jgi:two-component system, OmpR family, phosphate regulon sensor histidine kinase PhoR
MTLWLPVVLGVCVVLLLLATFRLGQNRRAFSLLELQLHLERERLKETREENAFLAGINHSFVDQARSAMLQLDASGKLRYFNPTAAQLLRLGPAAPGKPLIEVVADHDLNLAVQKVFRGAEPTQTTNFRPIGTDLALHATASALRNERGEMLGVTVVIEDLTELHRLEQARRELVANVSHDLRTPITSMKAMVETLQLDGTDRQLAWEFLDKINHELDGLAALVTDLLELSRIEAGHLALDIQTVPLNDIVDETMGRFQVAAESAGVSLLRTNGTEMQVSTDPRRASQVLSNLVDNAIKFSANGGEVRIFAKIAGEEACVTVEDTGAGIAAADLARIFERFYKVDKARTRAASSGTGLGLAIAKHLTQALGGRIWADSQEGAGSRFSFTLPLAPGGSQ